MNPSFKTTLAQVFGVLLLTLTAASSVRAQQGPTTETRPWVSIFQEQLPMLGHRNWIVIADSAYPWQTAPGIETVVTDDDQLKVLQTVLGEIAKARHVKPIIYTDAEMAHVKETDATGITAYREALARILGGKADTHQLPHEQIIAKLDEAGKTFHILLLKTKLTVPYTSVFVQLDCAYWNADAEKRLRAESK